MVSVAQFRKLVLALPDVEEKSHFGQPDFRVANKIFADLGREGGRATLKLTTDSQRQLREVRPEVFSLAPGQWGRAGWTYVVLDGVRVSDMRELLLEAWSQVAPTALSSTTAAGSKGAQPAKKKARRRS
jgi:hypothetical protein